MDANQHATSGAIRQHEVTNVAGVMIEDDIGDFGDRAAVSSVELRAADVIDVRLESIVAQGCEVRHAYSILAGPGATGCPLFVMRLGCCRLQDIYAFANTVLIKVHRLF